MRAMRLIFLSAGTALLLGLAVPASADEESQKGLTMSMDDMMKSCREHCQKTTKGLDDTMALMNQAKASKDQAKMRSAIDDAGKSMAEMKNHMNMCMHMMGMMGHMRGGMMGKGMMGGGQTSSTSEAKKASKKVTDPVCGMEVDSPSAPSATYKGKTYYFCSKADQERFEKNPEAYVEKPS